MPKRSGTVLHGYYHPTKEAPVAQTLLYKPGESAPSHPMPANGKTWTLDEVQGLVGGYVELIGLPEGLSMLVDEDGRMKGLPLNQGASLLAGVPIVGTALVFPAKMLE